MSAWAEVIADTEFGIGAQYPRAADQHRQFRRQELGRGLSVGPCGALGRAGRGDQAAERSRRSQPSDDDGRQWSSEVRVAAQAKQGRCETCNGQRKAVMLPKLAAAAKTEPPHSGTKTVIDE